MKKMFLLLVSLVALSSCKSNSNPQVVTGDTIITAPVTGEELVPSDPAAPTDSTKSVVPEEYLNIISACTSIKWYLTDAFADEAQSSNVLKDCGEILASAVEDKVARRDAIVETLVFPGSFVIHDFVKDCTFMPDVAIEFTAGDETVLVMYSFYCDVCRFYKAGKYVDFDGELVRGSVLQMASEVFPNDKYLRRLKRKG